jgi:threonylcarbamoyladenosine tRNA methylthiotransferase MtaB
VNTFIYHCKAGCTKTLKRMNRKYTSEDIKKATNLLRKNFEEAILTADIIVGFPGETEEEFEETYRLLDEIKLYKIHVFPYSKREGTVADKMVEQVSPEVKEKRSKKMIELSNKMQEEYNKSYLGKTVEVLIEEKLGEYYKGHTRNYIQVLIKYKDMQNTIVKAKVYDYNEHELIAKID